MAPVVRIPDLKEIASVRAVIALWNNVDISCIVWADSIHGEESVHTVHEDVLSSLAELEVPQCIAEFLKTYVQKVKEELNKWVDYHSNEILHPNGEKNELYCEINNIIWYSDGTINYKATAKNLLNSLRLSEIEKYHILCWYCLEDEIDRLSPLLFTKNIVDHLDFDSYDDSLILYWNNYFRYNNRDYKDVDMLRHLNVKWPAKEYFFDRLNAEEQVENVIWLLDEDKTIYLYLKQLLMKLNEHQLQQVYVNRSVQIINTFLRSQDGVQEILPTWYDVRYLITQDQFVSILTSLLGYTYRPVPGAILTEIWSSAGNDFRFHILNHHERVTFEKTMSWFKEVEDGSFLNTLLQHANPNLIQEIITRPFFKKLCEDLISRQQLSTLERLFDAWSVSGHHLIQFKHDFTKTTFFTTFCKSLLNYEIFREKMKIFQRKLQVLERLWNIWLSSVEEVTRFKRYFTEDDSFRDCCEKMLKYGKLSKLESILNLCLPDDGEFERNLAKNANYLYEHCRKLILFQNFETLEQMLKICFCNVDALVEFQNNLTKKEFFEESCRESIIYNNFQVLERMFNCCLRVNTVETARFKQDVFRNWFSKHYQFAHNFWESSQSSNFLESNGFLNLCFPKSSDREQFLQDLKREIIFSPETVKHFQQMILIGEAFNKLKEHIEEFLPLAEDQRTIRKQLIENLQPKITEIFCKYGLSGWKSLMHWYLEDEKAVLKLKLKLSIDEIFEHSFKECIFQTYDELHRAHRCTLRRNFVFDSLDRILNWYFESPKEVKEYKVQKINSYENSKTFDTLLKKNCHSSYRLKLINWFFENDSTEMAKFKKKHKGGPLANMIRLNSRESYFKNNRRTL
ncbi:uncharacterized protein LOC135832997 [Planococcus citri]|uniref:uncharacterized protein LOC135832997 n=1 Tax=Planococcus citri TaxID=170843 RepID=UPI0031F8B0DD